MAPFPVFDTEYVEEIRKRLDDMENNEDKKDKDFDYDELAVVACHHCKELSIITDEVDNDICLNCGAVNEIEFYPNIFEYKKAKEKYDNN